MSDPSVIPPAMHRYLRSFVARRRGVALLRSAGAAFAFAIAWMLAWGLVDRLMALSGAMRVALLIINIGVFVWLQVPAMRAILWRKLDWSHAAAQIERSDPRFVGRLETAVSQLALPLAMRGSSQMVDRIVSEANSIAAQPPTQRLVPIAPAMRPWWFAIALAILALLLLFNSWLLLPTLLQRQMRPLAAIAPVTTTRITVAPGDMDVPQGGTVTIVARATRLGESLINIRLSSEGRDVSTQPMTQIADGEFSFTLNDVDRDWHYEISGGDARTRTYALRVLRRPGVAQFRVRYVYPAGVNQRPRSALSDDGVLEAPIGTQAIVDLVCTEPVASAAVVVDGVRRSAQPTSDANVYRVTIPIERSTPYQVELKSVRGVPGIVPTGTTIRVLPDQPAAIAESKQTPDLPRESQPKASKEPDAPAVNSAGGFDAATKLYLQMLKAAQ